MKHILFFCAAMLAVLTCNAQSVQVLKDGKLIAEFYERDGWEFVFKEKEPDPADPYNGHEYVDLGLPSGLKWATMNVGATKPEEYGDYFAWGETEPKTEYNWSTYKWCNGSYNTLTKYCSDSHYGEVDNKTVLDPEDDAAHVNWGGDWRMPTFEEQNELWENCIWTWTTLNGEYVCKLTGPNGNSIFLPAAGSRKNTSLPFTGIEGDCFYWSSSPYYWEEQYYALYIYCCFNDGRVSGDSRCYGCSVRPVCP